MTRAPASVHQALHGYQDGHRLLASSVPINGEDGRQMLVLSDSPDARQIDPHSPLLSGYPLPSGDFYVLALTWPAPEVRRPGCVWTHSLLLSDQALASDGLAFLLTAFSRPEQNGDWDPYRRPLRTPAVATNPPDLPAVAPIVLWSLYDPPEPPLDLRIAALQGADPHSFLLAIWLQQWPGLRKAFSFAEAPRTARRLGERLIELQLTSSPQRSSWEQTPDQAPPRTITKPLERRPPTWCEALIQDLANPGELRDFLRAFGPSTPPSRQSLWALASIWAAVDPAHPDIGFDAALTVLARAFPDPDDAADLKQALLGPEPDPRIPHPIDEGDALLAIARADLGDGRDLIHGFDLYHRAARLLRDDEPVARRIAAELATPRPAKSARDVLSAIAAGLSEAQVKSWVSSDPTTTAALAAYSTELASRPALWSSSHPDTLWPTLGRPGIARAKRAAMLHAMLKARATNFAFAVLADWPDGPELLLEAIDAADVELPDPELLDDVPDERVLEWLKANGPSPPVAAALLEAWKPKQLVKVPVAEWNALQEMGGTLSDFTLVLLFLAATDPDSQLGPKRAVAAYEELHRRAASTALKKKALKLLPKDPHESIQPVEQAAARLSAAFLSADWPVTELLKIDQPDAFRRVVRAAGSSELVQKLVPALGRADATKDQGDAVWDALMDADISTLKKGMVALRKYVPW